MAAPHQMQPPVSAVIAAPPAAPMAPPLSIFCWVSFMPEQPARPRLRARAAASALRFMMVSLRVVPSHVDIGNLRPGSGWQIDADRCCYATGVPPFFATTRAHGRAVEDPSERRDKVLELVAG